MFRSTSTLRKHIELTIEDEYNTDKLCGYIEEHNRMIMAEVRRLWQYLHLQVHGDEGAQCPVRIPYEQAREQLQGSRMHHQQVLRRRAHGGHQYAKFDDNGYDTIVFDEIFFCSGRSLARIKRYCESNPDNIVVATGDTDQLECIECITDQNDYDK
ncbi:MAG: hypothetical protein ACKPKO_24100, partial [Candidatus Fonsibacter sp.]